MDCKEIIDDNVVERYLRNELSDLDQEAFEQHYFACKDCFEQVETARAIQEAHKTQEAPERAALLHGSRFLRRWAPAVVVTGLVLIVIVGALRHRKLGSPPVGQRAREQKGNFETGTQSPERPAFSLAELAHIEPPPYSPVLLRGTEDEATEIFRGAMRHYLKKDYAAAIPGLRKATLMDPQAGNAIFYLGACYLLDDQTDLAIQALRKTISLDDSNYIELAHFYLAKAHIRKNDIVSAKSELRKTMQLHGDREGEAQELERQLTQLTNTEQ